MQSKDRDTGGLKKVGLALGSGSARGWSHIGVIRALTEAGIRVDCVAGTSIGALVGAVYASGKIDVLEDVVQQLDWKQILSFIDVVFPKSGLIDGRKIADLVRQYVPEKAIEYLPIPFGAVATDLRTGQEVVMRKGDIIEAVRASISLPGIFTPVRKNRTVLVDGGLVNPLPVRTVKDMGAEFVIAVDLNCNTIQGKMCKGFSPADGSQASAMSRPGWRANARNRITVLLNEKIQALDLPAVRQIKRWMDKDPLPNIFEVLMTSIKIMEAQITAANMKVDPPDLLIQPKLGHINFMEFNRAQEIIAEGYRTARNQLAGRRQARSRK